VTVVTPCAPIYIEHAWLDGFAEEGESFLAWVKKTTPSSVDPAGQQCVGHILNLAWDDLMNDSELDLQANFISFLQKMATWLRKSALKTDIFIDMTAESLKLMKQSMKSRWRMAGK
jgi:hypothetical protein